MAGARSCTPVRPFSDDPRQCIRRTKGDYRGCRSSLLVYRFGRCGDRRGIALRLGCYGRLGLRVRSCLGRCRDRCSSLCRCTPAIGGCRPRRSGCVLGRYLSRRVCLGVLWRGVVRTGRRRMSRFRCCLRAFWFRRGRVGFLGRIGNIGFRRWVAGERTNISDGLKERIEAVWKEETACVLSAHTLTSEFEGFVRGLGLLWNVQAAFEPFWGFEKAACTFLTALKLRFQVAY